MLLGLGPETRQRLNTTGLRRLLQCGQAFNLKLVVKRAHPLGTETGNLEHLDHARRHFLLQVLQGLGRARLKDLDDLRGQLLADAGQPGQFLATGDNFLQLRPQSADGAAGIAIGPDLEGVFTLDLEVVGDPASNMSAMSVLRIGIEVSVKANLNVTIDEGNLPRNNPIYTAADAIFLYALDHLQSFFRRV